MSGAYQKFGSVSSIITGLAGLIYLASFILLKNPAALIPSICLLIVGIFSSATMVALYQWLKRVDESFALWGFLLGVGGAGGAAIHAAFDLASLVHPPDAPFGYANPVDPRGFLTFAIAGLAIMILSGLAGRGGVFPALTSTLGLASGGLLILLYVAYLAILNAVNPLVLFLIVASGLLQPVWYLRIGWLLIQADTALSAAGYTTRRHP